MMAARAQRIARRPHLHGPVEFHVWATKVNLLRSFPTAQGGRQIEYRAEGPELAGVQIAS
jgi:hypothetical protein